MKKITYALLSIFSLAGFAFSAEIAAKPGNNDWTKPASWDLGRIPQCGDIIVIPKDASIVVNEQIQLHQGSNCEKTQLIVFGVLTFKSGKKINLHSGAAVNVFKPGSIVPSSTGGGSSEQISLGTTIFWKASNGILNGKEVSPQDVGTVFTNQQKENTQKFRIQNPHLGASIVGKKGTKINIVPNALKDQQGQVIREAVDIELLEIYDRASMVLMNKATAAVDRENKPKILQSGGEIYLSISFNEREIPFASGVQIVAPAANLDTEMKIFDAIVNPKTQAIQWSETEEKIDFRQTGNLAGEYSFSNNNWGWSNIDKFKNDPRPKAQIQVKMPEGYDPSNAAVFVALEGENNSLCPLDTYQNSLFSEHYGYIPIGTEIHVITLSNDGANWLYQVTSVTVQNGQVIQVPYLLPSSTNNLTEILNGL